MACARTPHQACTPCKASGWVPYVVDSDTVETGGSGASGRGIVAGAR
jgi:hypothetical protein